MRIDLTLKSRDLLLRRSDRVWCRPPPPVHETRHDIVARFAGAQVLGRSERFVAKISIVRALSPEADDHFGILDPVDRRHHGGSPREPGSSSSSLRQPEPRAQYHHRLRSMKLHAAASEDTRKC